MKKLRRYKKIKKILFESNGAKEQFWQKVAKALGISTTKALTMFVRAKAQNKDLTDEQIADKIIKDNQKSVDTPTSTPESQARKVRKMGESPSKKVADALGIPKIKALGMVLRTKAENKDLTDEEIADKIIKNFKELAQTVRAPKPAPTQTSTTAPQVKKSSIEDVAKKLEVSLADARRYLITQVGGPLDTAADKVLQRIKDIANIKKQSGVPELKTNPVEDFIKKVTTTIDPGAFTLYLGRTINYNDLLKNKREIDKLNQEVQQFISNNGVMVTDEGEPFLMGKNDIIEKVFDYQKQMYSFSNTQVELIESDPNIKNKIKLYSKVLDKDESAINQFIKELKTEVEANPGMGYKNHNVVYNLLENNIVTKDQYDNFVKFLKQDPKRLKENKKHIKLASILF